MSMETQRRLHLFYAASTLENGSEILTDGSEQDEREYCGFIGNRTFTSWSGMVSTNAPILYPENDEQAIDYVRRIADAKCGSLIINVPAAVAANGTENTCSTTHAGATTDYILRGNAVHSV